MLCTITGEKSSKEIISELEEYFFSDDLAPNHHHLWDLQELTLAGELKQLAKMNKVISDIKDDEIDKIRVAFLVSDVTTASWCHWYTLETAHSNITQRVFYDPDEAEAWILQN